MFDHNKNGTIDAQEFSALWKYIQDWKACFERFDTDKSGNIDARELHTAFQTFGYNLSPNSVTLWSECLIDVAPETSTLTISYRLV